jgi:hypothetical protein
MTRGKDGLKSLLFFLLSDVTETVAWGAIEPTLGGEHSSFASSCFLSLAPLISLEILKDESLDPDSESEERRSARVILATFGITVGLSLVCFGDLGGFGCLAFVGRSLSLLIPLTIG